MPTPSAKDRLRADVQDRSRSTEDELQQSENPRISEKVFQYFRHPKRLVSGAALSRRNRLLVALVSYSYTLDQFAFCVA